MLRDDAEPPLPRREKHHFADKQHGMGEPESPTGPQAYSDLVGTETLMAGAAVAHTYQPL